MSEVPQDIWDILDRADLNIVAVPISHSKFPSDEFKSGLIVRLFSDIFALILIAKDLQALSLGG
jgi:hypothetical protein